MRLMIAAAILSSSFVLAGCPFVKPDEPPPPVAVKTDVAIAVRCTAKEPVVPDWAYDGASKTLPVGEQVKRMRAELIQRAAYEKEQLSALRQCTGTALTPPGS